ncbi:MAG: peroxisome- protein [Lichina confinis]|nr:MAG: peroxisome- protein [Lichina confinis]
MSASGQHAVDSGRPQMKQNGDLPTRAVFSPISLSQSPGAGKQTASIIIQKKSPLLATTPPQIARALAYSHPFLLRLNRLAGLVTWSTEDPWESFLLLAAFWAVVLYGDGIIRWAGPIVVAAGVVAGIYPRSFSPLPSYKSGGERAQSIRRKGDDHGDQIEAEVEDKRMHQHKSLDEIVEILHVFTARCITLISPFVRLADYLSTSQLTTVGETGRRPAVMTILFRLLLATPVWMFFASPPWRIVTTRRVVLAAGTLFLSWHSRPAQVSRALLWRSRSVRRICAAITGLDPEDFERRAAASMERAQPANGVVGAPIIKKTSAPEDGNSRSKPTGIRFTFSLWENQRRWLGLGWTNSLFTYERAPWTDEHLSPVFPKDDFHLPEVGDGGSVWRWVEGSEWRVEGAATGEEGGGGGGGGDLTKSSISDRKGKSSGGGGGWIYYDSKWRDGRRQDGWGRYTRRRKWCKDAELVEISPSVDCPTVSVQDDDTATSRASVDDATSVRAVVTDNTTSSARKRNWFKSGHRGSIGAATGRHRIYHDAYFEERSVAGSDDGSIYAEPDTESRAPTSFAAEANSWVVGDDVRMGLG